jgi:lysophospholipase L1-like esterase
VVHILLGTNDAVSGVDEGHEPQVEPAEYEMRMRKLVARFPQSRVLISVPPPRPKDTEARTRLAAYRVIVLSLAAQHEMGVDFSTLPPDDFPDGVHPDPSTLEAMAEALARAIAQRPGTGIR